MRKIEIYTTPTCGLCNAAKRLLNSKGASYVEISVLGDPDRRQEMMERAWGRYTVPQAFVDGRHIGGCNELFALERDGKLDPILAA